MGELLLGEYEVERPLGAGGMGHVVLVRSRATGQRFAVKRALPTGPDARTRLLAELQTWIDLPEFPHFVACRFFRTVGDEVALFAEYVEGGSLAERPFTDLGPLLDAAIQLAWGLHAAHRLGVVHQDVKPGNALLSADGVVKVGDFGLARASQGRGAAYGGAITRAYCSPEQADLAATPDRTARLTPATDQWSWAVTVLELFVGRPPCRHGPVAAAVLEEFLKNGAHEPPRPAMPPLVAEVLRKALQRRPDDRWPSLDVAADVLAVAYQLAFGTPYPRPKPAWPDRAGGQRTPAGEEWDDPLDWLRRVLVAAGEDPAGATAFAPAAADSRRARAVADLAPYDVAQRRLTALCQAGRPDLLPLLAELCLAKAVVHWAADDVPGCARLAEHAATLLPNPTAEQVPLLVEAHLRGAACARLQGRLADALDLAGRAVAVCEAHGTRRFAVGYLRACASRARTFFAQEDYPAALADLERARTTAEALVGEGRADLESELVELEIQTARVLKDSGEPAAATAWFDRALPRLERLADASGDAALLDRLAAAYLTRARLLAVRDDPAAAMRDADRAAALLGDLADRDDDLADVLALQAGLLVRQDRPADALPLFERVVASLDRLVGPLGATGYLPRLGVACVEQSVAARRVGAAARAFALSERGLAVLEPLAAERPDLASDLAWAHAVHGRNALALGQEEAALAALRTAVVLYDQLVQAGGRWDLLSSLLQAQRTEAQALADFGWSGLALERLGQALLVGDGLAATRETPAVALDLAEVRIDHAALLVEAGRVAEAQAALCEVMLRLERHPDGEAARQRALALLTRLW